jgi:DNA-binding IclR family transcriptional regulator
MYSHPRGAPKMARIVKSAARTIDLLEFLALSPSGVTLSVMSEHLGIPISSMHGLVATLEDREYLVRDPSSFRYRLGPGFTRLTASDGSNIDLVLLGAQVMDRMQKACEEAITMSVLQNDKIVFISNRSATSIVQAVNSVGTSLPAHATGSGKVILAHLPEDEFERIYPDHDLPPQTARTIQTKEVLRTILEEIKSKGYAYDEEESEKGVWAVASCIRNAAGYPRAALSIVVPAIRIRKGKIPFWTRLVVEGAAEISASLGWIPDEADR